MKNCLSCLIYYMTWLRIIRYERQFYNFGHIQKMHGLHKFSDLMEELEGEV